MEQTLETNAAQLLNGVTGIIKRYEERWQKTGEKYNLFEVAGIAHNEVIVCRVLADLMNPRGKHGQGSLYLKLFWETIAPKLPGHRAGSRLALDVEHTRVTTEYVIDENRRIDIAFEDGTVFVPIEVKIWAGDQPNQLADYFAFAQKKNGGAPVPVLYLTLDGHEPAEAEKVKGKYIKLSFKDDIIPWLEACLEQSAEKAPPVREVLKQFMGTVKSLCGQMEDDEMNDVFKLITESEDSIKAAAAISEAKNNLDKKVLELFKGPVLELVQKKAKAEYDSGYEGTDRSYPICVEVKGGNYLLYINYDWNKAWLWTENKNNASSKEGKALCEALIPLLGSNKGGSDEHTVWWTEKAVCPGPEFVAVSADRQVYLYRLYKLYTEKPQEVADRIVSIVQALEAVEGGK